MPTMDQWVRGAGQLDAGYHPDVGLPGEEGREKPLLGGHVCCCVSEMSAMVSYQRTVCSSRGKFCGVTMMPRLYSAWRTIC